MKIYYAHCMSDYYTEKAFKDCFNLEELGDVVNPSDEKHKDGWNKLGMDYANVLLGQCDVFAFRRLPDGRIPAGVAKEIQIAKELGLLIIELPNLSNLDDITMTREETRTYCKANAGDWYRERIKNLYGDV